MFCFINYLIIKAYYSWRILKIYIKSVAIIIENVHVTKSIAVGEKINEIGNVETSLISSYSTHRYFERDDSEKVLLTDSNVSVNIAPSNLFYIKNLWDLFKCALEEITFRGKACYYINNLKTDSWEISQIGSYFDKETGIYVF